MITSNDSRNSVELVGLSTDTKPTDVSPNSLFLELDTLDVFFYTDMGWTKAGEQAKQGIVSVEISPAIETDPTLDYYFPMAYDASEPISSYLWLYTQEALDESVEYTVTVTPSADWCCFDQEADAPLPKGKPMTFTAQPTDTGVMSVYVYVCDEDVQHQMGVELLFGID